MKINNLFYSSASVYYDKMIDFNSALQKRKTLLVNFIDDKIKQAADIGCGTGVDSISLAQTGLCVTAFDPSIEMINSAKENCKKTNAQIQFFNYSAANIPKSFFNKFDLIVSLGNTIANINPDQLEKSFGKFYKMLKADGRILIQVLNYEKILKGKERIVNITKKDNEYFIRFYDFGNNDLTFNILKFNADKTLDKELISTKIFPYKSKELKQLFKKTGFNKIQLFGGLDKSLFDSRVSNDLVIYAEK
ncbi:MAG: methyltransferase domain-containing protein [Ignavibacterium sp.]|jgi:ubiquinone/menaquinone biosynthesis C-methylase UbiE|nr:methyltransferase domain-containing protein [Ignavibacterium sp.]